MPDNPSLQTSSGAYTDPEFSVQVPPDPQAATKSSQTQWGNSSIYQTEGRKMREREGERERERERWEERERERDRKREWERERDWKRERDSERKRKKGREREREIERERESRHKIITVLFLFLNLTFWQNKVVNESKKIEGIEFIFFSI